MIPDIALGVALLGVLLFHFRMAESWREERRLLLNMAAARSTSELGVLQNVTALKPKVSLIAVAQARKEDREEPELPTIKPKLPHGL